MYKLINIKKDYPGVDLALYGLDRAINEGYACGDKVLVLVHGYGSHGVGGEIKKAIRGQLGTLKKQNKIATYVGGEEWGTSKDCALIQSVCPSTIISKDIGNLNSGITIVLLNN